ncbi:MAG: lysylphosphatidylglycerol synthase transmembrane domain-containing protein [bacterium]|nr:lysylphosphatidylglycerol synthase transmembrane domain-containing protein [bacterium]
MKAAKVIFIVLNLAIVGFLIYFLSTLEYDRIRSLFVQAEIEWLIIGLAFFGLSIIFKILRFGAVLQFYGYRFSFSDTAYVQMVGIAIAMMTPGRLGEASKIYLLQRKSVPVLTGTALTIFERIFDFLLLSLAGIIFALQFMPGSNLIWAFIALIAIMTALLFILRHLHWLRRFVPDRFRTMYDQLANLRFSGKRKFLVSISLYTFATWFAQALLSWAALRALHIDISSLAVLGVESIGTLAAILSFLPLGIGAQDLSMLFLYGILGVSNEAAAIVVLLSRTAGFLVPLLIALIMANIRGTSFFKLRSVLKPSGALTKHE